MLVRNDIEKIIISGEEGSLSYKPFAEPTLYRKDNIRTEGDLRNFMDRIVREDGMYLTEETRIEVSGSVRELDWMSAMVACVREYRE